LQNSSPKSRQYNSPNDTLATDTEYGVASYEAHVNELTAKALNHSTEPG
jgi:hypothetical protein